MGWALPDCHDSVQAMSVPGWRHSLTPVWPIAQGWPLHDAAASRQMEAQAAASLPPHTLMARAGIAIARLALAMVPRGRRVMVLAGPGNNGGDALIAAAHLRDAGLEVSVVLLGDALRRPPDAAWALAQARSRTGLQWLPTLPAHWTADLAIDGLLGLGLSRSPAPGIAEAILNLNRCDLPVLAIDLPSGLDGDHGTTFDGVAVRASHTVALLSLKPGLFTAEGRDHSGQVWFDSLGVEPSPSPLCLAAPPVSGCPPHAAHKGRFGDVVVIGGARGMCGAATLAAHAALAAGAGRVYVGVLDSACPQGLTRPELMLRDANDIWVPEALRQRTVVAGCGGGDAVRDGLPVLLQHAQGLVLDADALNALAGEAPLQAALTARSRAGRLTVLTPHPLEAARLLNSTAQAVQSDRLGAAAALAERFGAVVVLKGSGSLVARPDGGVTVYAFGNARLATAGTGDVLAGTVGGLWSRRAGEVNDLKALAETAGTAVARHGLAAERAAGHGPLLAADLITAMQALP